MENKIKIKIKTLPNTNFLPKGRNNYKNLLALQSEPKKNPIFHEFISNFARFEETNALIAIKTHQNR